MVGEYASDMVPDGSIWVVRDITLYSSAPTYGNRFKGVLFRDSGECPIFAVHFPLTSGWSYHHWSGRQVLEAGDQLVAVVLDDTWGWRISGYVLTA